jgi:dihydrodipicolinate synthase/N-acetylneuraminate lyase
VHRLGLIGEAIRLPLVPLSDDRRPEVEAAMRAAGVLPS